MALLHCVLRIACRRPLVSNGFILDVDSIAHPCIIGPAQSDYVIIEGTQITTIIWNPAKPDGI